MNKISRSYILLFLGFIVSLAILAFPAKTEAGSAIVTVNVTYVNENYVPLGAMEGTIINIFSNVPTPYTENGDFASLGTIGENNDNTARTYNYFNGKESYRDFSDWHLGCQYNFFHFSYQLPQTPNAWPDNGAWITATVTNTTDDELMFNDPSSFFDPDGLPVYFDNSYLYTIDLVWQVNRYPEAEKISPDGGSTFEEGTTVPLIAKASDSDNDKVKVRVRYEKSGGNIWDKPVWVETDWYQVSSYSGQPLTHTFNIADLPIGTYFWQAQARDEHEYETDWDDYGSWRFDVIESGKNLTVSVVGSGAVTSATHPETINCDSACVYSFDNNTEVTLAASASDGSTFAGWSGDCSGAGSCTVVMNAPRAVTATFEKIPPKVTCGSLDVKPEGGGTLPFTAKLTVPASTTAPGGILSFTWDFFDDGKVVKTTAEDNVTYTYTSSGKITASVTVSETTISLPSCTKTKEFNVNPWSEGDQGEVAP